MKSVKKSKLLHFKYFAILQKNQREIEYDIAGDNQSRQFKAGNDFHLEL